MRAAIACLLACLFLPSQTTLANTASAPVDCKKTEEPQRGKRVLQNQAAGRALDKSPIAIGLARRAKNKHLDDKGC